MGNMMRFMSPDTDSIVLAREATNNPIPENSKAPSRMITRIKNQLP